MKHDINMYIDSKYMGFFPFEKIGSTFGVFYQRACNIAKFIDWDEVILYAVFAYGEESEELISADFMMLRMDYSRYAKLSEGLSQNCRLFIVQNI